MIDYRNLNKVAKVIVALSGDTRRFGEVFEFCYFVPGPFWQPGAAVYFCRLDGTYQLFDQHGRYEGHVMPSCSLLYPIRLRSFL